MLEKTTYPNSVEIARSNDWRGRIDTLKRSATTLADYTYIGGRVAQRDYPVADVAFGPDYDNLGRVTVHQTYDYGPEPDVDVVRFDYTYETDENNIDKKYLKHRGANEYNDYGYDDLDRLTGVTYHDSDTEAFNMDDLGNRDGNQTLRDDGTVNFTVDDDTNRYTAIGGNSISHDDAGNMTVDKDGYQYTYNHENRVVKIEDVSDVTVATYAYDALGRRIRKVDSVASETTLYYYNPNWQVLAEYDDANSLQRYFVYGNYIDEPLVMNDGTDDYYYAHDHLYSVVALLEADGDVTERYEYDAYGTVTIYTDDGGDGDWFDGDETTAAYSDIGNPYTFTGRRFDVLDSGELKRKHYRARDYDTYMARFLQQDPLGYADGLNLYEYVQGNPGIQSDALGLSSLPQNRRVGSYTAMRHPYADQTPMSVSHEITIGLSNYAYETLPYPAGGWVGRNRKKVRKLYREWLDGNFPHAGELLRHYYKNRGPSGSVIIGGFDVGMWMDVKSIDYRQMIKASLEAEQHVGR